MCGIHGFISGSKKDLNADDYIRSGFVAGSLRGMDSSGVASILLKKNTFAFQKLPVSGSIFIQDKYAETLIRQANDLDTITIGHTRSATVGKVGYNGAHPFYVEEGDRELIGVHNGTLTNWRSYATAKDFDVDSEWALNQIFDEGADAFAKFSGAYCFNWWDSKESDVLNFALNDERPMHIAFTENGNMAYASEAGMLFWLLERHKVKISGAVKSLAAGNWYKFNVNNLPAYTKEVLAKYKPTVYTPSTSSYHTRSTEVENVSALLARIAADKSSAAEPTQVPLLPPPEGPRTPAEMNESAKRSNIMVLHNEQQTARDLQMMGARGSFMPYAEDADLGITHGTFSYGDMECNGIIRRAGIPHSDNSVWMVTCLGVQDDGKNNITAVCGSPHYNIKPKQPVTLNNTHTVH